jgi:hypothetical protein
MPSPATPLSDKLGVMQAVGRRLWEHVRDLPGLREQVAARQAEYASLLADGATLQLQIGPLAQEANATRTQADALSNALKTSRWNEEQAALAAAREVIRDMALESLSNSMIKEAYGISDAQGEARRLPTNTREAILDFARRGGHAVLPHAGFEDQWDSFVDVQNQTLDVLDRARGYLSEAAHVAAQGSPAEMEELIDRVFGSVSWQTAEYIKTVGFSEVPEGEDRSIIEDFFDRYITKRKEHSTEG